MRFAHISESISSLAGGLQNTVSGLCSALSEEGIEILLIAGKDDGSYIDNDLNKILLNFRKIGPVKLMINLHEELDKFQPDLIVQHGIWSPFVTQITSYSRSRKIPYVVVPHGMLDPYILLKNKIKKQIAWNLYQRENFAKAKLIRVLNEFEKEHVLSKIKSRIVEIPNGIKLSENREEGFVNKNEMQICFLGRIDHKKAVIELLEAWNLFIKGMPTSFAAKLLIAGWGSEKYTNDAKNIAKNIPSIEWIGPIFGEEKWKLLSQSGGFILPSRGEGLPTAVLEAWSENCVVIMSPECNFPADVFEDSAIRTSSSVQEIISSLNKFFALSLEEKNKIRKSAKNRVKIYDWNKIAKKFIEEIQV